ncbi:hypothetical protein [Marinomonas mediterranea]|jgi:hypothetical protein|uniref:Uncharacterized protein n=1 Tax=Marinomonas mediterranea (strain ATCC 700492 / JCM 21426 / NBRC 103028 / MMB-1) TaxID=717774 RepID=F2JXT5_MARM1|nr:hypothetical protein [Marinomonas mediterranea]ADZ93083.1 hypothetical protein Marme_3873 [Marinomonas mediterranea MMB-1]WCN10989.1 hypothetical protein GV055_19655 [Marinomonas mediterranea]WCN15051.1 hypothetical protein GV054_19560 [Marinomonas mediterranea]WCN19095.1 hypothetical protein GV053_19620 [Marinomonas mediterranea MMB-1]
MSNFLESLFDFVVEVLKFILIVVLLNNIAYYLGKGTLKLLSGGSYPPAERTPMSTNITMYVGSLVTVAAFICIILVADKIRYGI